MSKAIIIEHIKNGLYRVNHQTDISAIKARIIVLSSKIQSSNQRINSELQPDVDAKLQALNALVIPSYPPEAMGTPEQAKEIAEITRKIAEAKNAYEKSVNILANEKISLESCIKEKGKLSTIPEQNEIIIWCADYNTRLKEGDEVGVIDWYQFSGTSTPGDPVIMPGYLTHKESLYNKVRDGRKVPEYGLSTYSWWYAMMLLPCSERFNPHYRKAEVLGISENGLTVAVDPIYTQVLHSQATPLNASEITLTDVPARYLSCNVNAFEVGDRVILEYPRKNIHAELINVFEYKKQGLLTKKTKLTQQKTQLDVLLATQQAQINQQQSIVADKTKAVKDEQIANGIADLQTHIADIDQQLAELKQSIDNYSSIASAASQALANLTQEKSTLSTQKASATLELSQLMANNAPLADIQAKQQQINELDNQIALIDSSITAQSGIESLANSYKNNQINQQNSLKSTQSIDESNLFSLLLINTLVQQELDIALNSLAIKERKKTSLQNDKAYIESQIAEIDLSLIKLITLIGQEQGKSTALKAYTDTRPKEITVIGFVKNPRACQGVAYKNQQGEWRVVLPDGRDKALSNPPSLVGKFNWGVKSEDGTYDCACVWQNNVIRHGGYHYTLDTEIIVAGVRRYDNDSYLIKAVANTDNNLNRTPQSIVYSILVKDGVILSKKYSDQIELIVGNMLIDKTASFLLVCANYYAYYGFIYKIYLDNLNRELITSFNDYVGRIYNYTNYYDEWGVGDSTSYLYENNSLCYDSNGDIMIIAVKPHPEKIELLPQTTPYHIFGRKFEFIKIIFRENDLLKKDIVYKTNLFNIASNFGKVAYGNLIYDNNFIGVFCHSGHQLLGMVPIDDETYPIFIDERRTLKFSNNNIDLTNISRGYLDTSGINPGNGLYPIVSGIMTYHNVPDNEHYHATINGFSAGCIKLKVEWYSLYSKYYQNQIDGNMENIYGYVWLEYRGSDYKIVSQPSTDYTILI